MDRKLVRKRIFLRWIILGLVALGVSGCRESLEERLQGKWEKVEGNVERNSKRMQQYEPGEVVLTYMPGGRLVVEYDNEKFTYRYMVTKGNLVKQQRLGEDGEWEDARMFRYTLHERDTELRILDRDTLMVSIFRRVHH